jgi:hypothetical protein
MTLRASGKYLETTYMLLLRPIMIGGFTPCDLTCYRPYGEALPLKGETVCVLSEISGRYTVGGAVA